MNLLDFFSTSDIVYTIGWTLLHSFWQGAGIALVLGLILTLVQSKSAQLRYRISLCAMFLFVVTTLYTFNQLNQTNTSENKHTINLKNNVSVLSENNINQLNDDLSFFESLDSYFTKHLPLIVSLWAIGLIILLLRLIGSLIYSQKIKHRHTSSVTNEWIELLDRLSRKLSIQKFVKFVESPLVKSPCVIGAIKPVLLFPIGSLVQMTPEQVEMIILHELAHIKRHDYIVNIIQSILDIVFFFNPAFRWVSNVLRTEREHCCDDIAVSISGDSLSYARTLTYIEELNANAMYTTMAMSGNKPHFVKRIKRLFGNTPEKSPFSEGIFLSMLILLFICATSLSASSVSFMSKTYKTNIETETGFTIVEPDTQVVEYTKGGVLNKTYVKVKLLKNEIVGVQLNNRKLPKSEFDDYKSVLTDMEKVRELKEEMVALKRNIGMKYSNLKIREKNDLDEILELKRAIAKIEKEDERLTTRDFENLEKQKRNVEKLQKLSKHQLQQLMLKEEKNRKLKEQSLKEIAFKRYTEKEAIFKSELGKDGLLKNIENNKILFSKDGVYINDKKLEEKYSLKYQKLAKGLLNIEHDSGTVLEVDGRPLIKEIK